jgi:hypothetical protein
MGIPTVTGVEKPSLSETKETPSAATTLEVEQLQKQVDNSQPQQGTQTGETVLSQAEADALYEERMEEEYAKREGGA